MKCKLVLAAAAVAMACSAVFAAGRTMLAVPARHDMVGFGFDMLRQLPNNLELACYKGEDSIERLEVFDRTAWEWRTISSENWAAGIVRANSLVIAGENKAAADLRAISGWAQQVKTPSDRAKLDVVNAVNSFQPLNEGQWKSLGATYGFKFTKIERPSPRERLREEARARRDAARARHDEEAAVRNAIKAQRKALEDAEKARLEEEKAEREARKAQLKAEKEAAREAEKAQRDAERELERQRKLMMRNPPAAKPQMEVIPVPMEAAPTPTPVVPVSLEVKAAEGKSLFAQPDKTLPPPFEGDSAIKEMPPALEDAAKLKAAEANVKALENKAPETPGIVFKKRVSAAEVKVPEVNVPEVKPVEPEGKVPEAKPVELEVKVPEAKPVEPEVKVPKAKPVEPEIKVPEAKPVDAEAKVRAAVEAAVSEAAAKAPVAEVAPVPAPAAVEVRVPAREAVAPKVESPAVPATIPEATPPMVPETKPVEVTVPEVKVPAARPVEVAAPEVKPPEVKPVQTPEIKVPAIVLDPM
jgi:hypothetical protein